jgi:hypothetical protein
MIAYDRNWLDNLNIHRQLEKAEQDNCISREEKENAIKNYPVGFYTPHFFMRLGLFLLTIVILFSSFGLLSIIFLSSGGGGIGGILIFFGLMTYIALEFTIRKGHFRSGVDDAMLWISALFIVAGMNLAVDMSSLGNAVLIFLLASYLSLRFGDALMSSVAYLSLMAVFFFGFIRMGAVAKAGSPFLIMIVSAIIYFLTGKQTRQGKYPHYANCFLLMEITALICFYLAGNYYVVRETSNTLFDLHLKQGEGIRFGWLFWITTVLVPLFYIFSGIKKKDPVLFRVGLGLVPAIIFTVRYYYHVIPPEIAMLTGGILMVGIAYILIRYLRKPKYGFTSAESFNPGSMNTLLAESIVISEISMTQQPEIPPTRFGGGSGGGGGAGGEF